MKYSKTTIVLLHCSIYANTCNKMQLLCKFCSVMNIKQSRRRPLSDVCVILFYCTCASPCATIYRCLDDCGRPAAVSSESLLQYHANLLVSATQRNDFFELTDLLSSGSLVQMLVYVCGVLNGWAWPVGLSWSSHAWQNRSDTCDVASMESLSLPTAALL